MALEEPRSRPAQGPAANIALVHLHDGNVIPQLGFGVWQVPNDDATVAVTEAIKAGYRSIDTAQGYDNEEGVGRAIRQADIPRDDLFITSKLRTKSMGFDDALKGIDESLSKLGLDYLDMFLIHWPVPARDRYVETWRAFIQAKRDGIVRSIGVSNFTVPYLERIIDETGEIPVVNQVETHPLYQQRTLSELHLRKGIRLEAYSPLGTGSVLENGTIGQIAKKHERTPAQIIQKKQHVSGHIAIPKSVHPDRIRSNLDLFDFALDPDDLRMIAGLDDPNGKTGSKPEEFNDLY